MRDAAFIRQLRHFHNRSGWAIALRTRRPVVEVLGQTGKWFRHTGILSAFTQRVGIVFKDSWAAGLEIAFQSGGLVPSGASKRFS